MTVEIKGTPCTARSKRTGLPCGQKVIGGGVCDWHGGKAPAVMAAREQRARVMRAQAEAAAAAPHLPPASPAAILLEELHRTRVRIAGIEALVAAGEPGPGLTLGGTAEWLFREREQLGKLAESCLRFRVEEVQDAAEVMQSAVVAAFVRALFSRLGLDASAPEVAAAVRHAAAEVEGPVQPARRLKALP